MHIEGVLWSERSLAHVSRHSVDPDEVEDVVADVRTRAFRKAALLLLTGQTRAGRYVLVVAAPRAQNRIFVVTARDMTSAERRRHLRK